MGMLGVGSGDPALAGAGRMASSYAGSETDALRKAAGANQTQKNWQSKFDFDKAKQAAAERDSNRDYLLRKQIADITAKGKGFAKASAGAQKSFGMLKTLSTSLNKANTMFNSFTESQRAEADQPMAEAVSGMLPGALERMVQENLIFRDADVRAYRNVVAEVETKISKMNFGTQQTKFEMSQRKTWSPFAEGISAGDRNQRIKILQEAFKDEGDIFRSVYGPGYGEMPSIIEIDTSKGNVDAIVDEAVDSADDPDRSELEELRKLKSGNPHNTHKPGNPHNSATNRLRKAGNPGRY